MFELWQNLNDHAALLGVLVAAVPILWGSVQFILIKAQENKRHKFETYHRLIKDLVGPDTPYLDRQIAVVYELKNFKGYYPVTIRILSGLKQNWYETCQEGTRIRLLHQIDDTLGFIKRRIWRDRLAWCSVTFLMIIYLVLY